MFKISNRNLCYLLLFVLISLQSYCSANPSQKPSVLVTVAPHKFFVEQIANGTIDVLLIVPDGASSHTYEPTPMQILSASRADIWFRIGEPFEERAAQALKSHRPKLQLIDLKQGLDLIHHTHKGCCCAGGDDLHFWLSARQAIIQARTIAHVLSQTYPENAQIYQKNLIAFQKELEELDRELGMILSVLKNRDIFVSHPAYAYFCRDYDLKQYSIEMEGKDPTPQQMTRLLNQMRALQVRTIFIQKQYNNKAAKLISETVGAKIKVLNPYSENYMVTMREIAHAFANQ